MANTYLTKTFSSGGNQRIWTLSFWVKLPRSTNDDRYIISYAASSGSNPRGSMEFRSNANGNTFRVGFNPTGSSWTNCDVDNRLFRDHGAWYHVCVGVDTTQATASNRVKIYINGEQETVSTQPSQNFDTGFNHTHQTSYGRYENSDSSYFEGILSHIHFIDGTQYAASDFGSTDSTTGEWKINTTPSVTYGTNGYFILKDGNSVTDQSGNSNNFAVGGGTLTNTEDCPSNNFATMNPLLPSAKAVVDHANGMSNGNTYNGDQSPNYWQSIGATMAATSGKFYWEFKIENVWGSTSNTTHRHGIANYDTQLNNNLSSAGDVAWTDDTYAIGWQNSSGIRYNNSVTSGYGTYVANDILMFAMDLTNLKLYVGKNGTWENSGDPTSGSTGTGAYTIPTAGFWCPYSETKYGSDKVSWNIGNGSFRSTAISSEGTNASGIGKFEYDVPTGYTALSTKGLNE